MHSNDEYICRVCGLEQEDITWEGGIYPSHNICPCCGVEFGYEDCNINSIMKYRELWINSGAKWVEAKMKPNDWQLDLQLSNVI